MKMKKYVKYIFATMVAVLFAIAAGSVLWGAIRTCGYAPNDAHTYLLDTLGGAIIAFIAAQLGIVVSQKGGTFAERINESMGSSTAFAMGILWVVVGVFLFAGVGFVLLWVKPDWIAGGPTNAPPYIAAQAKAFVGVMLGAFAGLGPNAMD